MRTSVGVDPPALLWSQDSVTAPIIPADLKCPMSKSSKSEPSDACTHKAPHYAGIQKLNCISLVRRQPRKARSLPLRGQRPAKNDCLKVRP